MYFVKQKIAKTLNQVNIWSQRAKIVVFHEKISMSVFDIDYDLRLFGAVDVIHVQLNVNNITIYAIDFFTQNLYRLNTANAAKFLYSNKLKDFKGYCYRASLMYHYPMHRIIPGTKKAEGIDIEMVELVFKLQNASVIYTHDENMAQIWIKSAGNMQEHRHYFDFHLAPLYDINQLEKLYLPEREEVCITIPNIKRRLFLLQLLKPFQSDVWFFVTGILLVKFTIPKYLPLRLKQSEAYRSLLPFRRLFMLPIVWMEFLAIESYLAKAIAFLASMRYQSPPQTMADLDELRYPFWIYPNEAIVLQKYKHLQIEFVNHHSSIIQKLHVSATIQRCKVSEYWLHNVLNFNPETNDKKFILLQERPYSFTGSYHFARLSPFVDNFQQCIGQLFDSGIWNKIQTRWKSSEKQFNTLISLDERFIKFKDLNGLWILLAVGLAVGLMMFAVEKGTAAIRKSGLQQRNIWKKIKSRCRKNKSTSVHP